MTNKTKTASLTTSMTPSELRAAFKKSQSKVTIAFTGTGKPMFYEHYSDGDPRHSYDGRCNKKVANELLAQFDLTTDMVVAIVKAEEQGRKAKIATLKATGEWYNGKRHSSELTDAEFAEAIAEVITCKPEKFSFDVQRFAEPADNTAADINTDSKEVITMTIETKIAHSATEAVEILDAINFKHVTFEFDGDNFSNDHRVNYRHFDGINANGNHTCFSLIEIVIDGKLDTVRFINRYHKTATDIKIGNANYTLGDKGEIILTENNTNEPADNEPEPADVAVKTPDEKLAALYAASEQARKLTGGKLEGAGYETFKAATKAVDEFIYYAAIWLNERAPEGYFVMESWTEPAPPKFVICEQATDKRMSYSTIAETEAALTALTTAPEPTEPADVEVEPAEEKTIVIKRVNGEIQYYVDDKQITAEEVPAVQIQNSVAELQHMIKFYGEHHGLKPAQAEQIFMAIYADEDNTDHDAIERMIADFKAQNAKADKLKTLARNVAETMTAAAPEGWTITANAADNFTVAYNNKLVTSVDTITAGDYLNPQEFFDRLNPAPEPDSPVAAYLNEHAPKGWTVTAIDSLRLNVKFEGKHVADARVTKRDLIAPETFFKQLRPLVDKAATPKQMFLEDRYRELEELTAMRKECVKTNAPAETLAKVDAMIEDVKCEIVEQEFFHTKNMIPTGNVIDANGDPWF